MPGVTQHTFVFSLLLIVLGFSFVRALVARPLFCQVMLIFFTFSYTCRWQWVEPNVVQVVTLRKPSTDFDKKKCSWPVQDGVAELSDEGDTARREQDASPQDSSIQATLNWLLGAVKSLGAGLDEVKADNKNLRALVEKKKAADHTSVSPPTLSDGDDVAQVSKPVSAVTLPELRAMAHLSQKADRHVAQLGLANSSASSSDSDDQGSGIQSPLRKTDKRSHAHTGTSRKEGKITSTVLYPQSWPQCYLSITHGRRDLKYEELTLAEFVAGYGQILLSPDLSELKRSSRLKHLISLMYFPSATTSRLC